MCEANKTISMEPALQPESCTQNVFVLFFSRLKSGTHMAQKLSTQALESAEPGLKLSSPRLNSL